MDLSDSSEYRLWFYALIDAIELAASGDRDEQRWIFLEDYRKKPGSFRWVCDRLGFDPVELRTLLLSRWVGMSFYGRSVSKICREG